MPIFFGKKRSDDVGVVDLSDMQRRGIFKPRTLPKKNITPTDSQGYADLSKTSTNNSISNESPKSGGGFFDFFGNSASNNSQPSTSSVSASSGEYGNTTDSSILRNKIDDVEFKMENMSRKLNNFLERLELIEKKIGRLEGRGY